MTRSSSEAKVADAAEEKLLELCSKKGLMVYYDPRYGLAVWKPEDGPQQLCEAVPYRSYRAPDGSDIVKPAGETKDGLNQKPLGGMVFPESVVTDLGRRVGTRQGELRQVSTYASQKAFVYFDISDFSSKKPGIQLLTLNSLLWLLRNQPFWESVYNLKANRPNRICIGDGFIFAFDDCEDAVGFAAYLACLVEATNRIRVADNLGDLVIHYRMGIHFDWVFHFWDDYWEDKAIKGRWNYTGSAINGGKRVLDAIGSDLDDVVFLSYEVRQQIKRRNYLECLENKGRKQDKHKNYWRVYQLNHVKLGWGWLPRALLAQTKTQ